MKLNRVLAGATCALSLIGSATVASAGTPGIDFTPSASNQGYATSIWNLGYSFTVNSPVDVVGLGNIDAGVFPQAQQVGLWNSSGALLASAYVDQTDQVLGAAPWVFEAITPIKLQVGQTYIVGAQGGSLYTGQVNPVTVDPRITYDTDLYTYLGNTSNNPLVEPTSTTGLPHGWFGGNVELASAVPEPATWAMLILGLAMIGFAARRRREGVIVAA